MAYQVLVVDHSGRGGSYARKFETEFELDQFITELLVDADWNAEDIEDVIISADSGAGIEIDHATVMHIVRV